MNSEYPEINLATRLINKKKLIPPIDIFSLTKQYAIIESKNIPVDIDGISLYLKLPNKGPKVIINNNKPENRMRFTLAHELGHVLIPWHLGSIVDNISLPNDENRSDKYWYLETEANRFASELLMPTRWVENIINKCQFDIKKITSQIIKEANVSAIAATIKIKETIKAGFLFVVLNSESKVISSGRSKGTYANHIELKDKKIDPKAIFPFCKKRYQFKINGDLYYWWCFEENIPISIPCEKMTDWRILLDGIVENIGIQLSDQIKFKQSINAIIANANGEAKMQNYTPEYLYSIILQRVSNRKELKKFIEHPKFKEFITSKIQSFFNKI